jgi:tetratricopeptide (TPR) repeat protein
VRIKNFNFYTLVAFLIFFVACSTKKDNYATRNWQALNTKYNVLFNGNEAYTKGIVNLKLQHTDNFWEILPIERQIPNNEKPNEETTKKTVNPDFELAENKAVKAVQKRSIYIDGTERNYQIDESYLLLGKARYFDNRFIPALEAFNYILYKYPTSSTIFEAKIWREKTNIRLDNDEIAIRNLTALLKEIKEKNQVYADANAILAQAFIKIERNDSAVSRLKTALQYTKSVEEKARYHFILGQLNSQLNKKDEAYADFQSVIDMNRKSPRLYVIQAHAQQAGLIDPKKTDSVIFLKKFNTLLKDRENRPFLDVLHHQMALYYEKNNNTKQAKKQYKLSLKNKKTDDYLQASNYRNLAAIFFYEAKYSLAGKYYDSTLVKLNSKTREYLAIKKKRDNLDDVIKFEEIANRNDSILQILAMTDFEKKEYFEKHIGKLKADDAKEKIKKSKEKENKSVIDNSTNISNNNVDNTPRRSMQPPSRGQVLISSKNIPSDFYFYNEKTLQLGKSEFKKKWGERELKNNWRLMEGSSEKSESSETKTMNVAEIDPRYTTDFYLKKLPKKQSEIDELSKDRNFAYFQLGAIYKEKFKEYYLAKDKLEKLLTKNPEERLILPSMYNLYKIYEIIDTNKAVIIKNEIINRYPTSRYAQILNGTDNSNSATLSPDVAYHKLFQTYESGDYRTALKELEQAVNQFSAEEIVSKIELLKANTIGKVKGLTEFKKALNYVALTYPNTIEGKTAEKFVAKDFLAMEALQFNQNKPNSWKIIYQIGNLSDQKSVDLIKKISLFSNDRNPNKPIFSIDLYTLEENFVVLHGWKTEEEAKGVASVLTEYKDYKVIETPILISNDNYKIVQIKKNLSDYLSNPKKISNPIPTIKNTPETASSNSNEVPKTNPITPRNLNLKNKENTSTQINNTAPLEPSEILEENTINHEQSEKKI